MKFSWAFFFVFLSFTALAKVEICPTVIIHGTKEFDLTDNEKRLICGDKKVEAYRNIPPYQAQFFLTGFLQARSYLNPEFSIEGNILHVQLGEKSSLKKIIVSFPHDKIRRFVRKELKRQYLKKDITPGLLNSVESEALSLLRQRGFACVKVASRLNPESGVLNLNFEQMGIFDFGKIQKEEIEGLHKNALIRFYPMKEDEKFDWRLMDLTEKRMLRAEVVQGAYFLEKCSPQGDAFDLEQKFLVGPPRTLRFGVGASTEVGPLARVRWSNNRSGSMASTLSAQLEGSYRTQSFELMADTFFWKHRPRRSLVSRLEVTRESQIDYEQLLFKTSPASMKWTEDHGGHHWTWILGPSYEYGTYHSQEKAETRSFSTGVLEGSLRWTGHRYEFFDVHPQEGDELTFEFGLRDTALGFMTRALRLDSSYVTVKRLSSWGRGLVIGGLRVVAGTTWVDEDVDPVTLPPLVKFFGGGSDDVRGFALNTLPKADGAGALSKFVLKWELRRTYLMIPTLEAFAFFDHGYFGEKSFSTLPQMYYSPGVGLRWTSPIGIVQAYVAQGKSIKPVDDFGYNFFIGLGTTF